MTTVEKMPMMKVTHGVKRKMTTVVVMIMMTEFPAQPLPWHREDDHSVAVETGVVGAVVEQSVCVCVCVCVYVEEK